MNKQESPLIYLDHAATTSLHPEALAAMMPYFTEKFFNASSIYTPAQDCRHAMENSRKKIATALNANPNEIVFTSGGTESDNAAITGIATALLPQGNHIITSNIEHHAVLHTCRFLENMGYEVTYLPVDEKGMVSLKDLDNALTAKTTLVSIMLANNEIGTVQSIPEIANLVKAKARKLGTNTIIHTDAVQAAPYIDLDVDKLGVDSLSLSAHKFNGPKGVGFLYLRRGTPFHPRQIGGSHERNRRAGTENIPGIVGAAVAFEIAVSHLASNFQHCLDLRQRLTEGIERRIPQAHLNGHRDARLPNNVNFSFEGTDSQWTLIALNEAQVAASTGSACQTAAIEPSHVLMAIGVQAKLALGTLRLTLGPENTLGQIDYVLEILPKIIQDFRTTEAKLINGGTK